MPNDPIDRSTVIGKTLNLPLFSQMTWPVARSTGRTFAAAGDDKTAGRTRTAQLLRLASLTTILQKMPASGRKR